MKISVSDCCHANYEETRLINVANLGQLVRICKECEKECHAEVIEILDVSYQINQETIICNTRT